MKHTHQIIALVAACIIMFSTVLFSSKRCTFAFLFPKWEFVLQYVYMRVLKKKTLTDYWEQHADIRGPLEAWYEHVKRVHWATPQDVQRDYGDDVILPNNRAVFYLKGNKYRLVVQFHYKSGLVFIRFIGTHAEYNRIDATKT